MIHKRILKITILGLVLAAGIFITNPAPASAGPTIVEVKCPAGQVHPKNWDGDINKASCCPGTGNPTAMACLINKYVNPVVNLLAVIVGVVVLGSIIAGSIQYSASGGDPGKVSAAKKRILNAVLALAGFIFLYAFLQWVIPGGL